MNEAKRLAAEEKAKAETGSEAAQQVSKSRPRVAALPHSSRPRGADSLHPRESCWHCALGLFVFETCGICLEYLVRNTLPFLALAAVCVNQSLLTTALFLLRVHCSEPGRLEYS